MPMTDKPNGQRWAMGVSLVGTSLLLLHSLFPQIGHAADKPPIIAAGMPLDVACKNLKDNHIKIRRDQFGDEESPGIDPMRFAVIRNGNPDVFFFIAARPKNGSEHLVTTIYLYKDYERDSGRPKGSRKRQIVEMKMIGGQDLK
jgi:hypothetical protein